AVLFKGGRPMRRGFQLALGVLAGLAATSGRARGQYYYPGGFGYPRRGGWGARPAPGPVGGPGPLPPRPAAVRPRAPPRHGSDTDTVLKWNKALREQQRARDLQKQQEDAEKQARNAARGRQLRVESGETLNALLDQIFEFNPTGTKAYAAKAPISPRAIRDI